MYRLAGELGLAGWVRNATDGVHIKATGTEEALATFEHRLKTEHPPAAVITAFAHTSEVAAPHRSEHAAAGEDAVGEDSAGFSILMSEETPQARTLISPDLATCPDCLRELFDPADRRYHYPFINCTNCGPRFTIIEQLPYDRSRTSMAQFAMCTPCASEYAHPADRRFHAQPDACFDCGPQLALHEQAQSVCLESSRAASDALITRVAELLAQGAIVALKSLGGYHLACDATNEAAVQRLRGRKQRPQKPLAVMFKEVEAVRAFCSVSAAEAALLASAAAPIVLLQGLRGGGTQDANARGGGNLRPLAPSVTGALAQLGALLPSTPLQHLLMNAVDVPLVMTSGNLSEEPIIGEDDAAREQLGQVADAFLSNNRQIISRYDDSVVCVLANGDLQFVRRARGYAPTPLALRVSGAAPLAHHETLLAVGPEQKATFCLASNEEAFVSQHLGNLSNASTFANYLATIELYQRLFCLEPQVLVCDLHPDYLSAKWAREQAASRGIQLIEVQHHHAHIAAVLAEHMSAEAQGSVATGASSKKGPQASEIPTEVIGIALDGTGYGSDNTIWGGELLIASLAGYRRFAHLEQFRLPGGAAAIRHPRRAAYSLLVQKGLTQHPGAAALCSQLKTDEAELIEHLLARKLSSPLTSSAGRLFDAVSALLGVCNTASYEGEPAIRLEAALCERDCEREHERNGCQRSELQEWPVDSVPAPCLLSNKKHDAAEHGLHPSQELQDPAYIIAVQPLLARLLDGLAAGEGPAFLAYIFHEWLCASFALACRAAREHTGIGHVALSGGVFNNRFIAQRLPAVLREDGFKVLTQHLLPPNDGCISYGQSAVARATLQTQTPLGHC